jgi:integrase
MQAAVDAGMIARSPCSSVKLPAEQSYEMRFLAPAELIALLDATDEHHRVLVLTAAHAGLRWGELAGLRVPRVDVLRRTVTVVEQLTEVNGVLAFGPPKTSASRRSVTLPAFLAAALAEQIAARGEPGTNGLVFPAPIGGPLRRSNFRARAWLPATRKAGLDGPRFHDLRHTAAALAFAQGGHPKAIQERMGHSSVMVTLDRYGHLFEGLDERIATASTPYGGKLSRPHRGLSAARRSSRWPGKAQSPGQAGGR